MTRFALAATLLMGLCSFTACGSPDGGPDGASDAGTDTRNALDIYMVDGVSVTNLVIKGEKAVNGTVTVKKDGEDVLDATVTVNGVVIPREDPFGVHLLKNASLPSVTPGSKVTIKATSGGDSATLEFTCPTAVTIDSPAAGSSVVAGQTVTFAWSGKTDYQGIRKAEASVLTYNSEIGKLGVPGQNNVSVVNGTTATVTVPNRDGTDDGWIAQLFVPGVETTAGDDTTGHCYFLGRNLLQ